MSQKAKCGVPKVKCNVLEKKIDDDKLNVPQQQLLISHYFDNKTLKLSVMPSNCDISPTLGKTKAILETDSGENDDNSSSTQLKRGTKRRRERKKKTSRRVRVVTVPQ